MDKATASNEPARVNDQPTASSTPSSFRALAITLKPELTSPDQSPSNDGHLFAEAFSYELNRSLRGAAQIVGAESYVPEQMAPEESRDAVGQHAQMLGRAIGGFLPAIAIGAATRFGFGKVFAREGAAADHALLKRSTMGLSVAESGTTGFLFGSLLTPTENAADQSFTSIVADRMKSGVSSGLAFSLMSASSFGLNRIASYELGVAIHADKIMKVGALNGIVAGLPGGLANVEADSIVRTGKLDYDREHIGKSIYEMSLFGGTFGAGSAIMAKARIEQSHSLPNETGVRRSDVDAARTSRIPTDHEADYLSNLATAEERSAHFEAREKLARRFAPDILNLLAERAVALPNSPFSLPELHDFVEQNPARRVPMVEKVAVEDRAGPHPFKISRLEGLEKLSTQFPPPIVDRLVNRELNTPQRFTLDALANYVEKDPERRIQLIEDKLYLHQESDKFSPDQLAAVESLHGHFGKATLVMKRLLKMEENGLSLPTLAQYIDGDPQRRITRVAEHVRNNLDERFDLDRVKAFEELEKVFGADSPLVRRITEQNGYVFSAGQLRGINQFVEQDPTRRRSWVEQLAPNENPIHLLWGSRLEGLEKLETRFGKGSATMARLHELDGVWTDVQSLVKYIEANPEKRSAKIESMALNHEPDIRFQTNKLEAHETLEEVFSKDPETLSRLLKLDESRNALNLLEISKFIAEKPESRGKLVADLLRTSPDTQPRLEVHHLKGLEKVVEIFGETSEVYANLRNSRFDLNELCTAVENKPGLKQIIDQVAASNPNENTFDPDSLLRLHSLIEGISDSATRQKFIHAYDGPFNDQQILEYIKNSDAEPIPEHLHFVEKLLDAGAPLTQLRSRTLTAFEELSKDYPIGSPDMNRLMELERHGLKIGDLIEEKNFEPGRAASILRFLLGDQRVVAEQFSDLNKAAAFANELRWLAPEKVDQLLHFMTEDPASRIPLVEQQLPAASERTIGPLTHLIDPERLSALESLNHEFGADSEVMKVILREEGGNVQLSDLSKFIDADRTVHQHVVQEVALQLHDRHQLQVEQLSAVKGLSSLFGAESETMKALNLYDREDGFDLASLYRYLEKNLSKKALIEDMVSHNVEPRYLDGTRLVALDKLNQWFGEQSPQMQKIRDLESRRTVMLDAVADFIEYDPTKMYEETKSSIENASLVLPEVEIQEKKAFIERLIDSNGSAFNHWRLQSHFDLERRLGHDSPTVQKLLTLESEDGLDLEPIQAFIEANPQSAVPFVEKLAQLPDAKAALKSIELLKRVDDVIKPDRAAFEGMLKMEFRQEYFDDAFRFVNADPVKNRPIVQELLVAAKDRYALIPKRLQEWSQLQDVLGADSPTFKKLLSSGQQFDLEQLVKYAQSGSPESIPVIEAAVESMKEGTPLNIDFESIAAQLKSEAIFGNDSASIAGLRAIKESGADPRDVCWLLVYDQAGGTALIRRLLQEGASSDKFTKPYLFSRYLLDDAFGVNSEKGQRILAYSNDPGYLAAIHDSLNAEPKPAQIARVVESLIDQRVNPSTFEYRQIKAIRDLNAFLDNDPVRLRQLNELLMKGVDLYKVRNFVSESPTANLKIVLAQLDRGAEVEAWSVSRLREQDQLNKLASHFAVDSEVPKYLQRMFDAHEISGSRIANYVRENPGPREALVSRLVNEQSDAKQFKDVMTLSMFPESMAYDLAVASKNDGMNIPKILGNLRPLQSGQNFYNLVVDHAGAGKSFTAAEMQRLAAEAKMMPLALAPILQHPQPGLTMTPEVQELAKIHAQSVSKILETVPPEKNIVVLGRDMWTFLPLLKRSRDVQYFLWSRSQVENGLTEQQWRREVPPNSAVVDTGYSGSIINKIRAIDVGADGYLLSSTGKYPQLLDNTLHAYMAEKIETIPKLIGSSRSYTERGNVVSKLGLRDGYDVAKVRVDPDEHDRWGYEREVKALFGAMGLSPWESWRYTQFVGLTPRERIGVNTESDVQAHYARVRAMRNPPVADAAPPVQDPAQEATRVPVGIFAEGTQVAASQFAN